tara:strand:- start:706 stop:1020 length:315 start_codon:yes stop_codon:yes gene_type:complete
LDVNVQQQIESKLSSLEPLHLEVVNESDNHNVPDGSQSHFKVVIVTEQFNDAGRVARHRMVNRILEDELRGPIHALAIHAYTRTDWEERFGKAPMSPPCLGGDS